MHREVINERILAAIEMLWKSVLEIRDFSRQFTFFQSILLPEEYAEAISGKARKIVIRITNEEFNHRFVALFSEVEIARPFVGESIWALYSTYRAFTMRQALKVHDGLEKNKLYEWDKDFQGQPDEALYQLLNVVFSDDELSHIIRNQQLGTTASVMSALEVKLLNEMNAWVFNQRFRPIDLERQLTIQSLTTVLGNMNVGGDVVGRDKIIER